ncbi:uncharacterized protein LOC125231421 [Leguminivora glycinivorella]|uniref:uncharacterized protein LOC125231421 n=1 Tax=Leguminivora glycinivorella TaxID=1035111 RepID=UPI00200EF323|nr:uncharacterized protein LOC125231421 [Leguminivora glycinivorella]
MKRCGVDPKVKKTLVRNAEHKVKPAARVKVLHNVENTPSTDEPSTVQITKELDQPTLCSSELLANYLSGVKHSLPPPLSSKDFSESKTEICTKMTKKLNFHINDRMYKDLIELNASIDDQKTRRDVRPSSSTSSVKRDAEPNIEDFFEEETDIDTPPKIPVLKPKFKPIRKVDDGELHKLVGTFECL